MAAFGIQDPPGRDRPDLRIPVGVDRVLRHVPVEVGRTIVPPDRASLAERSLGIVHGAMGRRFGLRIPVRLRIPDRAPGRHQPLRQLRSLRLFKARVGHPPKPAADDEVASVRGHRVLHADFRRAPAAGFFAAASFAGFLPAIGISISFWPAAAFFGFLGRLLRSLGLGRGAADALAQRVHQIDDVLAFAADPSA